MRLALLSGDSSHCKSGSGTTSASSSREKGWIPIVEDLDSDADTKLRSNLIPITRKVQEGCFKARSSSLLLSLSLAIQQKIKREG